MFGFKNANVYVEGHGIIKTNLQVENGKFSSFDYAENLQNLDEDLIIVPGFIDEHIHGANGSDAMYATRNDLENIAKSITRDGVTSFLFTTMTMDEKHILSALACIKEYIAKPKEYANALGIHLEGPFISAKFCGAQDPQNIIKPSIEVLDMYLKESGNNIRIITFAYEESEKGFVPYLLNHNIIPSIGHSNCTSSLLKEGINEGIKVSTHTYNAMRGIHHRDVGIVGEVMLDDRLNAELIADLHHVSEDAIRLLYKCKGKDRIILITDSMEARFLDDGKYSLGGQDVYVKDGTARLKDGTLAGSILHMNDAIKNIKEVLDISLEDAIDMATINPARNLGIDKQKGSITLGKDADFAIVDKNMKVYATYVGGKEVYKGE